eukprot:m.227822 g.227822  ORF g.227822 m.227822 type:complete len:521 (-) comp11649_c0_seq1:844-2406(-)
MSVRAPSPSLERRVSIARAPSGPGSYGLPAGSSGGFQSPFYGKPIISPTKFLAHPVPPRIDSLPTTGRPPLRPLQRTPSLARPPSPGPSATHTLPVRRPSDAFPARDPSREASLAPGHYAPAGQSPSPTSPPTASHYHARPTLASTIQRDPPPYRPTVAMPTRELAASMPARVSSDAGRRMIGLSNLGNTCFMNSVLQCLACTPDLVDYILSGKYREDSRNRSALVEAFAETVRELCTKTIGAVVPHRLKAEIGRRAPQFVGYSQQDAQELLRFLLDGLHEDLNRATTKPSEIGQLPDDLTPDEVSRRSQENYRRYASSVVTDLFVGHTRSTLTCLTCRHVSVSVEPMWDLSLPIPARATGFAPDSVNLSDCLSAFTSVETLDGDEMAWCSRCRQPRACTKQLLVERLPRVLVLHLKRFSYTTRTRSKINTEVFFPLEELDMTPYLHRRGPSPAVYDLFAVSNHMGGLGGGHYTAYGRFPGQRQWHLFNDSNVTEAPPSAVRGMHAYVLFYVQRQSVASY